MERLEKLVFVHYNMRLRAQITQRREIADQLINLDNIFHALNPLGQWVREREDSVLDDRENSWLDEALTKNEALSTRNTQVERTSKGKGKQVASTTIQRDDNNGSNEGGDNGSGGEDAPKIPTRGGSRSADLEYTNDQSKSHGTSHQSGDFGKRRFGHDNMAETSNSEGVNTSNDLYNP